MTYSEFKEALALFGLEDRFTMEQFKKRHRELVKRYHPDSATAGCNPETIERINAAYVVIARYLKNYRFCCNEEEFYQQNPEEMIRQQFMDDPVWGSGRS